MSELVSEVPHQAQEIVNGVGSIASMPEGVEFIPIGQLRGYKTEVRRLSLTDPGSHVVDLTKAPLTIRLDPREALWKPAFSPKEGDILFLDGDWVVMCEEEPLLVELVSVRRSDEPRPTGTYYYIPPEHQGVKVRLLAFSSPLS